MRWFWIFCSLPLWICANLPEIHQYHEQTPTPSWVAPKEFSLESQETKPSQVNAQYILIDTQRNWEEKSRYRHHVLKILTTKGAQQFSPFTVDFDPHYTKVFFHTLRIFREGKWTDRLSTSRYNIVQRETDLEQQLYNGDLSILYFLEDLRAGDIVECAYSLVGAIPFFSSHYTDLVYMQQDFAVEKIYHRLVAPNSLSFQHIAIGLDIEPTIQEISPNLREWTWEVVDTPPYISHRNSPAWANPPQYILMSSYSSWEELGNKLTALYALPEDFAQNLPPDVQTLVQTWREKGQTAEERALLAIQFVQDQIRYLGMEEGFGAFHPTHPLVTLERRFGDCKDKSFLLHALLQLLDIPSTPVLVHHAKGKRIPLLLPSPTLFDHLVLQINLQDTLYYVDSTLSLQGGTLASLYFPQYDWGLLLSPNNPSLIPLPGAKNIQPITIHTTCSIQSPHTAEVTIQTELHNDQADRWRRSWHWEGIHKLEKDSLSNLQELYGTVSLGAPMEILDDRDTNTLTIREKYLLSFPNSSDPQTLDVHSYILRQYLHRSAHPSRSTPYALRYPLSIEEHIHIDNPLAAWKPQTTTYTQELEALTCSIHTDIDTSTADFTLRLEHLQDHVRVDSILDYWQKVKSLSSQFPVHLPLQAPSKPPLSLLLVIPTLLVWGILLLFSRKNRPALDPFLLALNKLRILYFMTTAASLTYLLQDKPYPLLLPICGCLLVLGFCLYIYKTRSPLTLHVLRIIAFLHFCGLSYFTFSHDTTTLLVKAAIFLSYVPLFLWVLKEIQKILAIIRNQQTITHLSHET